MNHYLIVLIALVINWSLITLEHWNVKILLEQFENPICTTLIHAIMKLGSESINSCI